MIALIQRVSRAQVRVDGAIVGAIGPGLLALVAVERGDGEREARRLCERMLGYRVFADAQGKMNLSLRETAGGLLLVSQFTLAADTDSGMRPSFTPAAIPSEGERWFNCMLDLARSELPQVQSGRFGAHMEVELVNDGPVTFRLRVPPPSAAR